MTNYLELFKTRYCRENETIISLLKGPLKSYLLPFILDVGAGMGDIAFGAFPDIDAILIDTNNCMPSKISGKHKYQKLDFFHCNRNIFGTSVKTILFIHVLQYIDEDLSALRRKIKELDPVYILEVRNDNTGIFGEILNECIKIIPNANPELCVDYLPHGFELEAKVMFTSQITTESFVSLAEAIIRVLMDAESNPASTKIIENYLRDKLRYPELEFDQTIYVYKNRML